MQVIVLELREVPSPGEMDTVVAGVFSSFEKAQEFCRSNKDYVDHRDYLWYWWAQSETVDEVWAGSEAMFFDWDGNEVDELPTSNKEGEA